MRYLCALFCIYLMVSVAAQAQDNEIDLIIDSKTICPLGYGGWLNNVPQQRYVEAQDWGERLAENGFIINCSAPKGPLRALANTAENRGAVVPKKFTPRYDTWGENKSDLSKKERRLLDRQRFFKSNNEILSQSAVFIALPGGVGCLSAILDILDMNQKKVFNRPLYFYNEEYWKPILTNLECLCPLPPYTLINEPEEFFSSLRENQSDSSFTESSWKKVKAYYAEKQELLSKKAGNIHYQKPQSLADLSDFFRNYTLKMVDAFEGDLILDYYLDEYDWGIPIILILNYIYDSGMLPEESKSLYKINVHTQFKHLTSTDMLP
jgi:predicted Rossmann-fold nucleotide-binding protein